jgi:small subunit ribosomal protein S5
MAEHKKLKVEEPQTEPVESAIKKEAEAPKKVEPELIWSPKTQLGRSVKSGEIESISQIIKKGTKFLESEITDFLVPNLESELITIGQAKGKFGGGKRRPIRQTQKKTKEGNKPVFSCLAVIGNRDGYVGVGKGTSKDTRPAREKAIRKAKLNVMEIGRGCGSWKCVCGEPHTLPFTVEGRCGSVRVKLMPAPKGTGLVVDSEIQKILILAGYKDIWAKTSGQTKVKLNFVRATMQALKKTSTLKMRSQDNPLVVKGSKSVK